MTMRAKRRKNNEGWKQQLRAQLMNKLGWSFRERLTQFTPPPASGRRYPQLHIKIENVKGCNNKKIYVGFTKRRDEEVTWLGWSDPADFPDPKHIAQLMLVA
jgi:hypothetical protein